MTETKSFLKSGFISVDIFAASPVDEKAGRRHAMIRRAATGPQLMSGIAVGEEAEQSGDVFIRDVGKLAAPLDKCAAEAVKPGRRRASMWWSRTRKIGHFFPAGRWIPSISGSNSKAKDATGKSIFWSGRWTTSGRARWRPGAHFYQAYQLDGDGNPINKRNAWQARSVLYVRGDSARRGRYGRTSSCRSRRTPRARFTLTAKLNYRKFSHFYTQFAYAGEPKPGRIRR